MPLFNLVSRSRPFPLPGSSTLWPLDRVEIKGVTLPLARLPETGVELDVEKRKQPGSDYSSYISHGIDTMPVHITVRLFVDITSGKDWTINWLLLKDKLVAKSLDKRNAINVYHPFLDMMGINSVIFTKIHSPSHERGLIFNVTLEGFNPKTLRVGSRNSGANSANDIKEVEDRFGRSRAVGTDKNDASKPTARADAKTYTGPSKIQRGQAGRPTKAPAGGG